MELWSQIRACKHDSSEVDVSSKQEMKPFLEREGGVQVGRIDD